MKTKTGILPRLKQYRLSFESTATLVASCMKMPCGTFRAVHMVRILVLALRAIYLRSSFPIAYWKIVYSLCTCNANVFSGVTGSTNKIRGVSALPIVWSSAVGLRESCASS